MECLTSNNDKNLLFETLIIFIFKQFGKGNSTPVMYRKCFCLSDFKL